MNSSAVAMGFAGLRALSGSDVALAAADSPKASVTGKAAERLFDLPDGFSCHVLSRFGETMSDGLRTPGSADGMAAFAGPDGKVILVRNHELTADQRKSGPFGDDNRLLNKLKRAKLYDPGMKDEYAGLGGTTTIIYDPRTKKTEREFLSLAGTCRNCAGGPTPWNTWITCEETVQLADENYARDHGFNFEVPALADGPCDPVPLKAMGRFNHEAVAVDPRSGIVYQTEDRENSLIYRFLPTKRGKLAEGGRLQALRVRGQKSFDTRNWWRATVTPGQKMDVEWVDMEDVESRDDEMRLWGFYGQGCARFARGEGMWHGKDGIYFACTSGGSKRRGQIWRYTPSLREGERGEDDAPGILELFVEPDDHNVCENCDNLTVAPWGDLFVCEDHAGRGSTPEQYILRITPAGKISRFARNALNRTELAGVTFSPDGSTLFVNIFSPGVTVAITGPWQNREAALS
ncbi:MAG: alkaline phosphatase PhoX [Phycisphaeraceae bacterium]